MAFSTTKIEKYVKKGILQIVVTLKDTSGNSDAFQIGDAVSITFQGQGTFGGGAIALQGSNDGVNFYGLPTPKSINANGITSATVDDYGFMHYRLALTGGDATTNVLVTLIARIRQAGTP